MKKLRLLTSETENHRLMKLFHSIKHILKRVLNNKLALNNTDDKSILRKNRVETLPYYHVKFIYWNNNIN